MKKIFIIFAVLFLLLSLSFISCKKKNSKNRRPIHNPINLALLSSSTVDDKSWCQAMHDAINEVMYEMPGEISKYEAIENMQPADAIYAIRSFANEGFNVFIIHGSQFRPQVEQAAKEFPEIMFAFGTTADIIAKNVFSYMPESEETGFLSGIVAGLATNTNHVGLIGPVDGGDSARYNRGFVLGVQSVNPNCKIDIAHVGSFNDLKVSAETAQRFIRSGCDILTGSSQQAIGAFRVVANYRNNDIWWVAQSSAQIDMNEGYKCIGASSYNFKILLKTLIENFKKDALGGKLITLNFKNGGFEWVWNKVKCGDQVTAPIERAVEKKLEEFQAKSGLVSNWRNVDYTKL